jgi:ATP-dependent Clp protease adaptor protein ClpS
MNREADSNRYAQSARFENDRECARGVQKFVMGQDAGSFEYSEGFRSSPREWTAEKRKTRPSPATIRPWRLVLAHAPISPCAIAGDPLHEIKLSKEALPQMNTAFKRLLILNSLPRLMAGEDDFESGSGATPGTTVVSKPKSETKTPSLYRVIIMNDDYTPMEFVIHVLQRFFHKDLDEATKIMLQVHHQGSGVCGVFSYEIAETKVYQVNQYARQNRHPLKCTMEKA